jgi:hypothetical protein
MHSFWTNTIWYIALGVLTIFELILVFRKTKEKKFALAFYITATGITLAIEVTLFFVFAAYDYYPKIIPNSYYNDELSGNLFSQFSISATALLIAVFNLKFYWILIFSGIYGMIEELFLALGIYSHNWYKTWITVVGLIPLFLVMKRNYIKGLKGPKTFLYYVNIFFSLITLDSITILWAFMLSGYQNFSKNLGGNPIASPYLIANLYSYFIFISLMFAYFFKLKPHYKTIVILSLYCFTFIFTKLNIIYVKDLWWYMIFSTTFISGVYFSIVLMDYLYKSEFTKHIK